MSRSVVLVDAVRTPFGKAGSLYAGTRADDLIVRAMRGLLERNPKIAPTDIDDVAIAAATQSGDQGMNIGRSATLLAGLPNSVPGYSIDRWCAGALTAMTTIAGSIAMGAYDVGIAGGVEHMGNHPMGEGMDPNPRYLAEKIVEQIHPANVSLPDSPVNVPGFENFSFSSEPLTLSEIHETIEQLKSKNSSDNDGLSVTFLKKISLSIS